MAAPNILCDCTGMSEKRWLNAGNMGRKVILSTRSAAAM